ncbi:MAG: CotH kinase family protein [Bacteroidales bacterium]|nr:CotH kinase family protein [Bacteroidales bacterium]MCF8455368.1 CotH kinase family protein [Bacteroidales bacterium]
MNRKSFQFSFIAAAIFMILGTTAKAQDLYDINNFTIVELNFQQSNWDQLLDNLVSAGQEGRLLGTATVNGVFFDSVGVRYKGNSSYQANQTKNPLNIKLDYTIKNQEYDGHGTLKLSNVFKDPTFVREVLSYEILQNYLPASKANYAKVYINGNYIGFYVSVQSVDKYFISNHFSNNDQAFFKGELTNSGPPTTPKVWGYFGADSSNYSNYYELESDYGWDKLVTFLNILNNQPQNVEDYLNVDRHLWMLAFDILCVNLDAPVNFGHNYYLYEDNAGRFNPIMWDLNENFGVFGNLMGQGPGSVNLPELDLYLNSANNNYPIIKQIFINPQYKRMYVAHLKTIMEDFFANPVYMTRANELQTLIATEVQNDPNKLYSDAWFTSNLTTSVGSGQSFPGIQSLMQSRMIFLNSQSDLQAIQPTISGQEFEPAQIVANTTFTIRTTVATASTVWLGMKATGSEQFTKQQMFDDGLNNDLLANDGIYGTSLSVDPGSYQYYFYAENSDAGRFYPARAEYEFLEFSTSGNLVINEFMASNQSTMADQDGEFDDWVEIYNNGTAPLNLLNYALSDDGAEPAKWMFPDTTIAANGYMIIWADKDSLQDGLHANFKLSASGESIILSDNLGGLLDQILYTFQQTDVTTGRYPNGTGSFIEMSPTFSSENMSTVSVEEDFLDERKTELYPCFPNPFNQSTTVQFFLSKEEKVKLGVFNMMGTEIREIENSTLHKGEYAYAIHGDGIGSGIYLVVMTTSESRYSRRVVVVK